MLAPDPTLAIMLSALSAFWKQQAITCPPVELPYVQAIAEANKVILPPDFEQLYRTVNGTPDLYPNFLDDRYCSFLPVEALRTEEKEVLVIACNTATLKTERVTVFVDYMHRSWEYGFIVNDNENYQIGIIPTNDVFKVITTSLATFLEWYIADADVLYDYRYPDA
ncbi:hypothetical protein [Hymenobacter sp. GOD-10R]|uniref:hypothetical protein n=1 Tax=Hymenobacter sp. GOD-10R TaxID=3093922 RepID=UPI002D76A5DA|nr:hypothetical protein [Hymenobacter sp. GOD-10R]WRQ31197.1 hypothetical protein SD425_13095 [Hymenobacter sp. GOD-10R]